MKARANSSGDPQPDLYDTIHNLVTRWRNDDLSDQDFHRLRSLLADDPSARRLYVQYVYESVGFASLFYEGGAPSPCGAAAGSAIRRELLRRPASLSLLVAALSVAVIVTALAFIAAPYYRDRPKAASDVIPEIVYVAQLSGTHHAVWGEKQTGVSVGAHLAIGHTMVLKQGFAEVTYRNGAVVVLEGPCALVISDVGKCWLNVGRIAAKVPHRAVGFTVDTAYGSVVDLGTEFGVEVQDDSFDVAVFRGSVQATNVDGVVSRLVAGDRARINNDSIENSRLADEHPFVRNLPGQPQLLVLSGSSVESNSRPPWILEGGWNGFADSHGSLRPRAGSELLWSSAQVTPRQLRAEILFDRQEHTIAAGHYRLTVDVGKSSMRNSFFTSFVIRLTDENGVELPQRAPVRVVPPQNDRWSAYVVNYSVAAQSSSIGKALRLELVGDVPGHHSVAVDNVGIYFEPSWIEKPKSSD